MVFESPKHSSKNLVQISLMKILKHIDPLPHLFNKRTSSQPPYTYRGCLVMLQNSPFYSSGFFPRDVNHRPAPAPLSPQASINWSSSSFKFRLIRTSSIMLSISEKREKGALRKTCREQERSLNHGKTQIRLSNISIQIALPFNICKLFNSINFKIIKKILFNSFQLISKFLIIFVKY